MPDANQRCGYSGCAARSFVPDGAFDLIVLSEIGYYFNAGDLSAMVSQFVARLAEEGVLLSAHWLGCSHDHLLSGDQVHGIIGNIPGLAPVVSQRQQEFRIDLWRRHDR